MKEITTHTDRISSLTYSPDGKTIATGSWDGTMQWWNASTGQSIIDIKAHTDGISSLTYSPDGKTIATGSWDGTMRWWEVNTRKNSKTFTGYLGGNTIQYSPDEKTITITAGGPVHLWDVTNGKYLRTFRGHKGYVPAVDFSPDGKVLATGSADKTVRLWDLHTGKTINILTEHTDLVYAPMYSPDGKIFVTRSRDNTLRLWNANTGENIETIPKGNESMSFMFSPDSTTLAVGNSYGTVDLLNTRTGEKRNTLIGHSDRVYTPLYSTDGKTIITHSRDGTARLWDAHTAENIRTLKAKEKVLTAIYSPNGDPLAITANREKVSLWNVSTAQLLNTFDGPRTQHLVSKIIRRFKGKRHDDMIRPPEHVRRVEYSPNGKTIAAIRNNETVQLWNVSTGKHIGKPIRPITDDPLDCTTVIVYSPDGKTIATFQISNRGGTVRLWNTTTGKKIKTLKGHDNCSNSFTFSPDSKAIITAHQGGTVLLWDIPTR